MTDFSLKKTVFADVDDTVCPSTQPVTAPMAAELNRLIAKGRTLAFVSGSTVAHLRAQLMPSLKGEYHFLGASGTHYVRIRDSKEEEIFNALLPAPDRSRILEALRSLVERHEVRSLTTEADQIQDRGSQITFSAIGRHAPEALKRSFDPSGRLRQAWVIELKKELGDAYSVGVGGTTSLDITKAGLDKGWGVREFLKYHHLDAKDALYFGDKLQEGGNDYPVKAVVDCVEVRSLEDTLAKLKLL